MIQERKLANVFQILAGALLDASRNLNQAATAAEMHQENCPTRIGRQGWPDMERLPLDVRATLARALLDAGHHHAAVKLSPGILAGLPVAGAEPPGQVVGVGQVLGVGHAWPVGGQQVPPGWAVSPWQADAQKGALDQIEAMRRKVEELRKQAPSYPLPLGAWVRPDGRIGYVWQEGDFLPAVLKKFQLRGPRYERDMIAENVQVQAFKDHLPDWSDLPAGLDLTVPRSWAPWHNSEAPPTDRPGPDAVLVPDPTAALQPSREGCVSMAFETALIPAGGKASVGYTPPAKFRAQRLVIPWQIAGNVSVLDVRRGKESLLNGGAFPGSYFREDAEQEDWDRLFSVILSPGDAVIVDVINQSAEKIEFSAELYGPRA